MSSSKNQPVGQGRRGRRDSRGGRIDSAGGAIAVAVSTALSGMIAQQAQAKGGIKVEKVARGTAQITTRGPNTQIRVSDRAIINYRQFDVGRKEGVQFIQPSASSRVLNRINSGEPSRIDGRMSANGIVYFVNPAGVMFGRDAVVNVGKLYAAAANISDGDFVNGINRFVGGLGTVLNEGKIHADAVTLVGRRVINQGEILSTTAVTMVAGEDVLVGERDGNLFVKVDTVQGLGSSAGNTASAKGPTLRIGAGDMFSVAVYNEGKVRAKQITAQSGPGGATVVSGTLDASSKTAGETGGTVKVLGEKVAVAGATIDASGPAGGGTVLVGGDFQGKGDVPTASRTVVTAGSTVKADATQDGTGGTVVVWADGGTTFAGGISARGGAAGGDGGNVEVSGKQTLNFTGNVDTTAPLGHVGSLLLDPNTIEIVGGGIKSQPDDVFVDVGGALNNTLAAVDSRISTGTLEDLGKAANVTLTATTAITSAVSELNLQQESGGSVFMMAGEIHLGGTKISTHGGKVTLEATTALEIGGITTNKDIATPGGDVKLTSSAGTLSSGPIITGGGNVEMKSGTELTSGAINSGGGNVTLDAGAALTAGLITTSGPAATPGGFVKLQSGAALTSAGVTTSGGAVTVTAATDVILSGDVNAGASPAGGHVILTAVTGDAVLKNVSGGLVDVVAVGDVLAAAGTAISASGAAVNVSGADVGTPAAPVSFDAPQALVKVVAGGAAHVGVATPNQAVTITAAADGSVKLSAQSQTLEVTYAPGGDLTLAADGDLLSTATDPLLANALTLRSLNGAIGGDAPVLVDATTVSAAAQHGRITLSDPNGAMSLGPVAAGGAVSVIADNGNLTIAAAVDAGTHPVTLRAGNDVLTTGAADAVVTGGDVNIRAGKNASKAKIGEVGKPVLTSADSLTLQAEGDDPTDSAINLSEANGVMLASATTGKGNVSIDLSGAGKLTVGQVTGGAVTLKTANGAVEAGAIAATASNVRSAGGPVIVTAGTGGSIGKTAGLLKIDAGGGNVTLTGASIHLEVPEAIDLDVTAGAAGAATLKNGAQTFQLNFTQDLSLNLNGAVTDTTGQKITAAGTIDLATAKGIGAPAQPIVTAAAAIKASAKGTGGVYISDDQALPTTLEVKGASTEQQAIEIVSKRGSLNLTGTVKAGTDGDKHVLLSAGVEITTTATTNLVDGDELTLNGGVSALTGSVGTGIAIGTHADKILATGRGDGSINLKDVSGAAVDVIAKGDPAAFTGPITIVTDGTMNVTADGGAISLTSNGGSVTGSAKGTSVNALSKTADVSLDTATGSVTANAATGISITNSAAGPATAFLVTGGGDVTFTQVAALPLVPSPLTLNKATTGSGQVTVTNIGDGADILLGGPVTATTTAKLTAGGHIKSLADAVVVSAPAVALEAGKDSTAGDLGVGELAKRVHTDAQTLKVKAVRGGNVFVTERDGLTLDSATSDAGNISIIAGDAAAGDLVVKSVSTDPTDAAAVAAAGSGRVALESKRGAITDGNGSDNNIVARELSLKAASGVGVSGSAVNALETAANKVAATGGTRGIYIDNSLALRANTTTTVVGTVKDVDNVDHSGLTATDAAIELNQHKGNLQVDTDVKAGASSVLIQLTQAAATLTNNSKITGTGTGVTPPVSTIGAAINAPEVLVTVPPTPIPAPSSQGVTLVADQMALGGLPTSSVDAGGKVLTVRSFTDGTAINLGVEAGGLSLTQAELSTLKSTDHVEIGHRYLVKDTTTGAVSSKGAGDVVFGGTTTLTLSGSETTLSVVTAGSINGAGNPNAVVSVTNLSLTATKGIGTASGPNPLIVNVQNLAATASTPVPAGTTSPVIPDADISLRNNRPVTVTTLAGVDGITGRNISLVNDGTITVGRPVEGSGNVSLKASPGDILGNAHLGAGGALGAVADGSVFVNGGADGASVLLHGIAGNVGMNSRVRAGGTDVVAIAGSSVESTVAGQVQGRRDVRITAETGHVELAAPVRVTERNVTVVAGTGAVANPANFIHTAGTAPLQASVDLSLTAKGHVKTDGKLTAGRHVDIDAATTATVNNAVVAGADLTAISGLPAPVEGHIKVSAQGFDAATRDAIITGTGGTLDARGDVTLTGPNGNVLVQARVNAGLMNALVPPDTGMIKVTSGKGNVTTGAGAALEALTRVELSALGTGSGEGNLRTQAQVTARQDDIVATSDAGTTVAGKWTAGNDILMTVGGDLVSTTAGSMEAGRHVLADVQRTITVGAPVTAGKDLTAMSGRSAPTTGDIELTTHLTDAHVTTQSGGSLDARNHVIVTANRGDIHTQAPISAGFPANGAVQPFGASITLWAGDNFTNYSITTDRELRARDSVTLDATRHVDVNASVLAAERDISVRAWNGHVLTAAPQPLLGEAGGHLRAGRHVDVTGNTFVDLGAPVESGTLATFPFRDGHINVLAETQYVATGTAAPLDAATYVSLDAPRGDVTARADVSAGQHGATAVAAYIFMNAGAPVPPAVGPVFPGSVTTGGVLHAGDYIRLQGRTNVTIEKAATSDSRHIEAVAVTGDVTTGGKLDAATHVLLEAGGNVGINESVLARSQDITAVAHDANVASNVNGDLTAQTFVSLEAGLNIDLKGTVTAQTQKITGAAGKKDLVHGSITTADTLRAGTSILLTAPEDVSILAPATSGTVKPETPPGDITVDAGGKILTTGALDAWTFISLTAGKNIEVNAPALTRNEYVYAISNAGNILTGTAGAVTGETYVDLEAPLGEINLKAAVTANKQYIQGTASGNITVENTGSLLADSSVLLRSKFASVLTHGPVTATRVDIRADAAGDVLADAKWKAGNDVVANAGNDVRSTLAGTIFAGHAIGLDAKHDVSLNAAATADSDAITATAKNDVITFVPGVLDAGTSITLTAGHDVALAGNASTERDFIKATADNDIRTTTARLDADSYVELLAEQNIDLNSPVTAKRQYLQAYAKHGDITTGNVPTGPKGELTAGEEVDVQAREGKIDLNAKVTAGGFVQALALNDITTAARTPTKPDAAVLAKDYVLFKSSKGSIITHDSVTAAGKGGTSNDGDILANAFVDITIDNPWKAYRDIVGTAGQNITTTQRGTLAADRHINLTATANDITLGGSAAAGVRLPIGDLVATAGHDVLTSGQLSAAHDVELDARHSITSGTNGVSAGNDITYHAATGDILTLAGAILDAKNDVLLDADAGKIDLHDDVKGARDVTATATKDITTYQGAPLTATNRNATLTSKDGSILTQDLVKAGTDLLADAAGDITLTGGWQSGGNTTADARGDVNVRSTAAYGAAGVFKAGRDVAFTSTGALVKGNGIGDTKVTAGNDIGMVAGSSIDGGNAQVTGTAGHDIKLALVKSTFPGTGVNKDQAAVTLVAGSNGAGSITDLHTFNDASGALSTPSVVATGGGLNATATNAINVGTQVKWVVAESKSEGDITLNEVDGLHVVGVTTADGAVNITSGDTMVVRSVIAQGKDAADASLHAYKNHIEFEDGKPIEGFVKAGDHKVTLTAAGSINGNVGWKNVIAKDLQATAGGTITLGTDVENIVSASNGMTTLHDFGDVTLADVTTSAGDVVADVNGTMTVNRLRAGSAGGNNATLTAGGSIVKGDETPNVWANRLVATANAGEIDLKTRVATVHSKSKTNTTLVEQDAITLERVESETANVTVTSGGPMAVQEVIGGTVTLDATGNITGDGGAARDVTADLLDVRSTGTVFLETAVGRLKSNSVGDATFREKDDVEVETIDAHGKTVTLNAGGLVKDGNGAATNVTTGTLVVDARGVNLDTDVDRLSIAVTPGAYDGNFADVAIREKDGVTVERLTFNAPGNLDFSGGGNTSLNVTGIDTRGGNQLYAGALTLVNADRNFTFTGHNIALRASLDSQAGGAGYAVTMASSGQTSFLRPVGAVGKLATLTTNARGSTTIKTQIHTAGAMIFNDPTTIGGDAALLDSAKARRSGALVFNDTVTLGGTAAVLQTAGGAVRFAKDVVGSSGDTTIHSNTGYVEFAKGIVDSNALQLNVDATDGNSVTNDSPKFGDVLIVDAVNAGGLSIKGGNITVGPITVKRVDGGSGNGDITLTPDPRITFIDVTSGAQKVQLGDPQPVQYASPVGLLTLKGNLKADGTIELGDVAGVRKDLLGGPIVPTRSGAAKEIASVATIVAYQGDSLDTFKTINLDVEAGSVKMGVWDKMTVLGGVQITAHRGGEKNETGAILSDIAALDYIRVESPKIELQLRPKSLLLNDNGVLGLDKPDFGIDFYANKEIKFSVRPTGVEGVTPEARVDGKSVEFGVAAGFVVADVPGFNFRLRKEAATSDNYLFKAKTGTIALDATAEGPSSTAISTTLTQALPQETPKPTEDTNLSTAKLKDLVAMGIYARNPSEQEMVDRVSGRVVYLDLPPNGITPRERDYTVVVGKLPMQLTDQLIQDDKQLPDVKSKDADKREAGEKIRDTLAQAFTEYTDEHPETFDPGAFSKFLAEGKYLQVAQMLGGLNDLLKQVDDMGLTPKQVSYYRDRLIDRVRPKESLGAEEMYQVIKSAPAGTKFSYAPRGGAGR